MGFEVIVAHPEFDIFTSAPTFHHISIGYHDLEVVHMVYKIMGFFSHLLENEIVSTAIVNQDYDLSMLDVACKFQGLWSRNTR
jgi:hypothetical protein